MNGKIYIGINEETKKTKTTSSSELLNSALCTNSATRSSVTGQCSEIVQLTSRLVVISVSISGNYYGAEQAPNYRED